MYGKYQLKSKSVTGWPGIRLAKRGGDQLGCDTKPLHLHN